jgi:hypothetical protein
MNTNGGMIELRGSIDRSARGGKRKGKEKEKKEYQINQKHHHKTKERGRLDQVKCMRAS